MSAARALLLAASIALGATARAGAQSASRPEPMRLVLEAGVGGGHFEPACRCRQVAQSSTGVVVGRLALGLIVRPQLSVYLSEDGGADISFDGSTETYQFHTALAEVEPARAPALVLRAGAGFGRATALSGSLVGTGAVVRGGVGVRTPTRHVVAAAVAVDAITAVSGHYEPQATYLGDIRPTFRPLVIQVTLGLRLQIPLR